MFHFGSYSELKSEFSYIFKTTHPLVNGRLTYEKNLLTNEEVYKTNLNAGLDQKKFKLNIFTSFESKMNKNNQEINNSINLGLEGELPISRDVSFGFSSELKYDPK